MKKLIFDCLQPKITKDFILSKINQESIMQHYIGVDINSKKLFVSPFRTDKHVTCSIYKSKNGVLYLHDFATNEHVNCFEAVMRLYNVNFYESLNIIARDFRLIEGNNTNIKKTPKIISEIKQSETSNIQCQLKDFTEEELDWWKSFGVDSKLLKKYHVYSIQHVFLNGNLKFSSSPKCPIFGYYFGKDKNHQEKWKLYFHKKTNYRFIGNLSKKILQGYKQLPKTGDILVITKSMKDVLCLKHFGINAVAPNSETIGVEEKQLNEFKQRFNKIVYFFDNDRPGRYNLAKLRKQNPELLYFFIPFKHNCKDISDMYHDKGEEYTKNFINYWISKI